jgi:hypothetical protein
MRASSGPRPHSRSVRPCAALPFFLRQPNSALGRTCASAHSCLHAVNYIGPLCSILAATSRVPRALGLPAFVHCIIRRALWVTCRMIVYPLLLPINLGLLVGGFILYAEYHSSSIRPVDHGATSGSRSSPFPLCLPSLSGPSCAPSLHPSNVAGLFLGHPTRLKVRPNHTLQWTGRSCALGAPAPLRPGLRPGERWPRGPGFARASRGCTMPSTSAARRSTPRAARH